MSDLLKDTECNFCYGFNATLLLCGTDRYYTPDVLCGVIRCESCGLMYFSSRVKEDHIGIFYQADNTTPKTKRVWLGNLEDSRTTYIIWHRIGT